MNTIIHSRFVASVSDLKKNPMKVVNDGYGEAVAILNRNNPAFYCIPVKLYEKLIDLIDDKELLVQINTLQAEETIPVQIDDLKKKVIEKKA